MGIGKLKSGGVREYFWNSISKVPIRRINFENAIDVGYHTRLVDLVRHLLGLHSISDISTLPEDKAVYHRQINVTENQIDKMVYEIYGLDLEEIGIVEQALGN